MTELGVYVDGEEIVIQDDKAVDAKLREYGLMFSKLMESDRFKELVSLYFTFIKEVNEETREINFQVIENPPEVIAKKMQGKAVSEQEQIKIVSGSQAQAVLDAAKKNAGGRRHKDPKRR
jgi:hypothetical protein